MDEVSSTNEYVRTIVQNGYPTPCVIIAGHQTSGRGQGTNSWESEAGKNLLLSICFEELPKSSDLVMDSMKMALAIVVTLKEQDIDAKVKWPNDVYVGDKKIAGILVENTFSGSELKFSVTGIGLNVNQETFNESIAVSMRNITGKKYDLLSLSHDLIANVKKIRIQSERSSLYMINSHLYRKNEEVDFEVNGVIETYTVKRICENGKLGVERNGESKELEFHRIKWVKGFLA